MPKNAPSILKTHKNGTLRSSSMLIDRMINFCSCRFFMVLGCYDKYMKKAVLQEVALLFSIVCQLALMCTGFSGITWYPNAFDHFLYIVWWRGGHS